MTIEEPKSAQAQRPSWSRALLRLWLCMGTGGEPRGSPHGLSVLLGAALLAAWVAIDRWQQQPAPEFSADGIPLLAWYALALLALAGALRWASRPRPTYGAALLLALGLAPAPLLLVSLASYFLPARGYEWACVAVAGYVLLFLNNGLYAITGRAQRWPALCAVIGVVAFIGASDALNVIPDLWNPRAADPSVSEDQIADRETALFEQAARIDAALAAVHRDDSPEPQAFFLGFAGVGDQKVFAQEIGLAARVIGERYAIGDRHVALINDERDLERAPLASVTGLAYVLRGLAERMRLDRDVLFLSISSHGSDEPSVEVANSAFPLTGLTADDLAEALNDAGIEWRVIVISACYAGGFIEPLRNPQTIILTAAAKDRTSFGCSNDDDLTYFGEAFYRDALPEAKSLRDAFATARQAIAQREQNEHETPSEPQAYFGPELENKLTTMERKLASREH